MSFIIFRPVLHFHVELVRFQHILPFCYWLLENDCGLSLVLGVQMKQVDVDSNTTFTIFSVANVASGSQFEDHLHIGVIY